MAKRQTIKASKLGNMFPSSRDKLPNPVEHNGRRKRWVGIGYVDEGAADGTEMLLVEDN